MATKIRRLSRVTRESTKKMDSVEISKRNNKDSRAFDVLLAAKACYDNMERFRADRRRNKRYNYGDQWKDIIYVDGKRMTEEDYIKEQGSVPLKNNLIRRLVRNVLGAYHGQSKEPICKARDRNEQQEAETLSTILQYNMQLNKMSEIYARSMEDFLIGGLVAHRKWYGWQHNKLDCWTDYVHPDNFIIDTSGADFRGWDIELIGQIHDMSLGKVLGSFANTPEEYRRIENIYGYVHDRGRFTAMLGEFGYDDFRNLNFFLPHDSSLCRVYEIWKLEHKPRLRCKDWNSGELFKIELEDKSALVDRVNEQRIKDASVLGIPTDDVPLIETEWFIDNYWYCYYLTPTGDILKEEETQYAHKEHPYVFKAYPFIDGEIHSFVSDVIDQQRYVNRLITLYDWIMRSSAKGVLLAPEDCFKGMDINEVADEWTRFNGVILFKPSKSGQVPQQVSVNSTNIGISELLNLQLKFFEDISGVHGALQGKAGASGTSGALYAQQAQNASTSLLDLLESFSSFVVDAAYKDVMNIQQFYDEKKVLDIAGASGKIAKCNPYKIKNVEFDMSIAENTATPAYRMQGNDFLMQIWAAGQITLEQMLENGDFPFADNLLQSIKAQQSRMEQGEPAELSPELMQEAQNGANMNAVNQLYSAMRQAS